MTARLYYSTRTSDNARCADCKRYEKAWHVSQQRNFPTKKGW